MFFKTRDKIERVIDQSLARSLNQIGVISIKDLRHLKKIVLELINKADSLLKENKGIRKLITEK